MKLTNKKMKLLKLTIKHRKEKRNLSIVKNTLMNYKLKLKHHFIILKTISVVGKASTKYSQLLTSTLEI